MTSQVLVDASLFHETADGLRLVGGRCRDCGTVTFPVGRVCASCASEAVEPHDLGTDGTLWSFTVQGFRPKSPPYAGDDTPETFVPYGVGYVELPGEVRIESRLTVNDPARLRIGMPMRLTTVPFGRDDDRHPVVTFAFEPAEEDPHAG
jgi:uncharacterized OB-fold protein